MKFYCVDLNKIQLATKWDVQYAKMQNKKIFCFYGICMGMVLPMHFDSILNAIAIKTEDRRMNESIKMDFDIFINHHMHHMHNM